MFLAHAFISWTSASKGNQLEIDGSTQFNYFFYAREIKEAFYFILFLKKKKIMQRDMH